MISFSRKIGIICFRLYNYTKKPLLSGFLSADNANLLREEPAIMVKPYRSGKVIVFADDMNFRSYFFGTSKLFMNALFYNKCM